MSFIMLDRGDYKQAEKLLCSYRDLLEKKNALIRVPLRSIL